MATEEHKYLADIIKNIHATLREEAQNYGPEIAWERHVARKDVLQIYASSMQKLATTYWRENNLNAKDVTNCRMEWIISQCKEYFLNGGKQKYNEKEESINLKMNADNVKAECFTNCNANIGNDKVTLLDVGSCYNPFGCLDMFDVTAIDLNSVPDQVLSCDFLNVPIGNKQILSNDQQEVLQLRENSFDVVVFSLFLEYLPCPIQRHACCQKAYDLLKPGGILFIVSPDSKHVAANAKFMKSWRYALSKLGFMRIKYEKLRHIHCIIFRKCAHKHVAVRWANLQTFSDTDILYKTDAIYIPQDFRNANETKQQEKEEFDESELTFMFSELPFDTS